MKKLFLSTYIIAGAATGIILSRVIPSDFPLISAMAQSHVNVTAPLATPTPTPNIANPITFAIPKLDISTDVESVGLDNENNMDVPKNAANVGWYNLGAKPGAKGNAVLAGHYDDQTGAPAVFYNISSLEVGDTIEVVAADNKKYIYLVTGKEMYPVNDFPIPTVFGPTDKSRLNLITCQGVFDRSAATYTHRLVVFSELKEIVQ